MPVTRKGCGWQLAQSWWVPLLFTFYLAGPAFIYIGIRARRFSWVLLGFVYSLPVVYDQYGYHALMGTVTGILCFFGAIILYVWSIFHGLVCWAQYITLMEARALGVDSKILERMDDEKSGKRKEPGNIVPPPPPGPIRTEPELSAAGPETKNVDPNLAAERELADLPGVGVILAKKAIRYREANGGFRTADEFFETLRLPPHAAARLRPLVTVGSDPQDVPPSREPDSTASLPGASPSSPPPPPRGRVVDY
jgi:DNA uptake protein ComE-like DNA-binding protein